MTNKFVLTTSTASISIFDPEALKHRLNEPPDWWSDFMVELDEVNAGNVMIVGLGSDGNYETQIGISTNASANSVSAVIRNISGQFFVGPGEEITGGTLQPSTLRNRTGIFLEMEPSTYRVTVTKTVPFKLTVSFSKVAGNAANSFEYQLLLEG